MPRVFWVGDKNKNRSKQYECYDDTKPGQNIKNWQ